MPSPPPHPPHDLDAASPGSAEPRVMPELDAGADGPREQRLDGMGESSSLSSAYYRRRLLDMAAMLFCDCVALVAALSLAMLVRAWLFGGWAPIPWAWILIVGWVVGVQMMGLIPGWAEGSPEELRRIELLAAAVFATFTVSLFLGKQADLTSRVVVFGAWALSAFLLPLMRFAGRRFLMARGLWGVDAVILGDAAAVEVVAQALRENPGFGYRPVSMIAAGAGPGGEGDSGEFEIPDSISAPVAIVARPFVGADNLSASLDGLLGKCHQVLFVPDFAAVPTLWVKARDLAQGLLLLEVSPNQLDPVALFIKRVVDLGSILLTLPLWLPLMAVLALLKWFEDGSSPFYLQERLGAHAKPFRLIKFRTMVPDAEAVLEQSLQNDEALKTQWEEGFKLKDDPRVTRIGALMRRTSLDELPQLLNVLRGEMSLVGPRPLPDYHHGALSAESRRLREGAKPGMTGLWQVSGRSETGNEGLERWDAYYVRNWSVWLDFVILARTVVSVLSGRGAY